MGIILGILNKYTQKIQDSPERQNHSFHFIKIFFPDYKITEG